MRTKQCNEIKEHLLNKHYKHDVPQFLCGDFNIEMDDRPNYEQMLKTLDAENGELIGNVKVTYDEVNNNLAKIPHGKSMVIDYVLVRKVELVHNVERKVQTFFAKVGGRSTHLSDHYDMEFLVNFNVNSDNLTTQFISIR